MSPTLSPTVSPTVSPMQSATFAKLTTDAQLPRPSATKRTHSMDGTMLSWAKMETL